jgi:amino acid adenylation domain-containing protein/non-ribosomal peptide synthase protein (TIGR01720 family)
MDTVLPAPDLARFTGRGHDAHRDFWRDMVAEIDEPIAFPTSATTTMPTFRTVPFSAEAAATLARISGGAESGRLVVVLAALARVLAAEGGGTCILVDVPPLPTMPDGGETLPIPLPVLRQGSIRDLLAATRDRVSAGFAHQDYPVRRLAAPSLPEAPILVTSDTLHGDGAKHGGAIIRLGADGLRLRHPDAASLALRIDRALAGFAETTRDLATVELLTPAERDAVAAAGEGPPGYAPASIWQLFVAAAERHPTRIALRAGDETLTYAALRQRAEAVAGRLRAQHGVGPGALVGLVPARNAAWIVGLLGIMAAGGAYLPIVADQPAARRDALLAQAAPALLVTAGPAVPGALPVDGASVRFDAAGPAPEDLAYVLYTSGSTGEPKGVMIAHAGFASMIRHQIEVFGVTPEDRVLQLAAASFDASLSEIFMALLAGAALVLIEEADVADTARFTAFLAREDVTVATITPPHLAAFDRHPLPTLRVLIMAGDVADPAAARLYAADRAVFNAYGPTEVSVCASIHRVDAAAPDGPVPIGRAVAGSRIHVLDAFGCPRPPGVAGEIVFEGPGVALGYLGRESDAFVAAPGSGARAYRTGDAGLFLPDGSLAYLGRIDQQVKLRGHRVEPAEVAQALRAHPLVREAHVAPLRAPGGQTELAAYVVLRDAVEFWPSIAEFFVYDDLAYGAMAGDETRNAAYRAAFARHLPGRIVLEVGPGAEAVLSRMAIAAGARKVYAVEINPIVADQARARLRREGLEGRVEVITGDIMTVALPEKADICISEIVGAIGGAEGSAILIEATRRWLKDPAAQIPARSLTRIAGVSLDGLGESLGFPEPAAAYAERIFAQEGRRFDLRLCLKNLPLDRIVTGADVLEDLDYRATLAPAARHAIRLPVTAEGRIDALLAWLHLVVDAGHPDEAVDILHSRGSWLPVVLPLDAPSPVLQRGDDVVAVVTRQPCANGLNPDFRIEGSFRRDGVEIGAFLCEAPHVAPGFRASPLHAAAFDEAGAPRRATTPAAQLRAHLEGLLPGWMMPAHILPLDRLPLNASGKVDRKALPEPVRAGTTPTSAATPLEATIAGIIAEVLGLGEGGIGTCDDFFALGGDSIRAIQVAARLGAVGVTLGSTDILASRTVAAMAPLAREKRAPATGPVAGPFPPTPIQAWFLHRHGAAPNHFNQSMLLRAAGRLEPSSIAPALDAVAAHHDALRSRFTRQGGAWQAEILAAEPPTTVPVIEATAATLEACCAALQAGLDLAAGPIWRAAILRLPDADRLLWVVHHLAVDWVSWRILLQDLELAVAAQQSCIPPALPPRSDGFVDWATALSDGAATRDWEVDADWWRREAAAPTAALPMAEGADDAGAARMMTGSLDAPATEALLGPACRRHDADMQDLLLAALATASRPRTGPGRLRVVVEGHGREALLAPLDCSRTVGWFTSFHPVQVPLPEDGVPPVAAVRAALRQVPRRGLGYLIQATRPGGVTIPAQIGLNYLGRMDDPPTPDGRQAPFRFADESAGPALDPAAPRPLPIEILAQVAEGRLHLALTFTPARMPEASVRGLLDDMIAALSALAAPTGGAPVLAADTSLAGLGAGAIDSILSDWD